MIDRKIVHRCALAAGVAVAAMTMAPAVAAPELENFAFLQTSTVRVVTYYPGQVAFGTGWVARTADPRNANNAVIVTAAHLVRGATRVTVLEANSAEEYEANVRAIDLDRDIAFLEVRGLRNGGTPLRVTSVVPPVGQDVRTTGYTAASDRSSRRQLAEISGVLSGTYSRNVPNPRPIWEPADVGVAQFQHSINLSPGFSGGPVIDKCGRVVGFNISNGGQVQTPSGALDIAPGISFAVASTEILKAARDNGIDLVDENSPCPTPPQQLQRQDQDQEQAQAQEQEEAAQSVPWYRQVLDFLQSRNGLALIIGLFALIALAAAWMFLRKSRGSRSPGPAAPKIETAGPSVGPSGPIETGGSRTLILSGKGPGGEQINLRIPSDELQNAARTVGTEGQAHIPDNRVKYLVSRLHAEISHDGENFYVQDMKSLNGTTLDGQPLPPFEKRRLHDGASLILADLALGVRID